MLQIYNTFTQQKETFRPIKANHIGLYVCGITVYDLCHLGHARVFVAFDVIVRFLRASGWTVKYVRNITDIDDKIIKRANENKEPIQALTARFIEAMHIDANALNLVKPDVEPKATESIDSIITMVKTLQDKGFAYVAQNGDVYFSVESFDRYGQLSHKDLDQLQAGARVDVVEQKRSPLDFVLWKMAKENEPSWPSPWGEGRPGWHIECSAMSIDALGETFDIHGGGHDLIFPHHENERAQSECATSKPFVNNWMHVGFVQVDKEKMSKSLNNFFTIREILEAYDPEVVRYFLMSSHYRSPINYSTQQLDQAKSTLERLYTTLRDLPGKVAIDSKVNEHKEKFFAAMNDDFNTPVALSVLFELTHLANSVKENDFNLYAQYASLILELGNMIGILTRTPEAFLKGKQGDSAEIDDLITQRENARKEKNWAKADEIRQALLKQGVVLEDTNKGTIWRRE